MSIALKILAFISACGIAIFDFSKFQIIAENPYYFDQVISYYFLPAGLVLALFYFTGFLQNKVFKKITAVLLMVFSGFHLLLKIADIVFNLADKTLLNNENIYQSLIWVSQIILLVSFFLLGLSFFKNKLRSISAYLLIVAVIAHALCYVYYLLRSGYSASLLFDSESEISFILTQSLVLLGYVGIYLKEVWFEEELLK